MTDKKKQPSNISKATESEATPSDTQPLGGNEPWRKWNVKPDLVYIPAHGRIVGPDTDLRATETGIGKRIAYCRGQLDNLSVEALARYTKNFDTDGISRMSVIRYEAGENLPGARELRILCDALWVSPGWMLTGIVDAGSNVQSELEIALQDFIFKTMNVGLPGGIGDFAKYESQRQIEQRQQWIDEARKVKSSR